MDMTKSDINVHSCILQMGPVEIKANKQDYFKLKSPYTAKENIRRLKRHLSE